METANLRSSLAASNCLVLFGALAHPVSIKNHPIPPIHPTRMCRGKNPIRAPRRNLPRMKKITPVRREEKENATRVVAITAWGLFSPIILVMSLARMLKNGWSNQGSFSARMAGKTTYYYLYHHPADSTCETATAEREHELGDDSPKMARSSGQE